MFWYEILIVIAVLALDLGSKYGIVKALGIEHVAGGKFVQHNDEYNHNILSAAEGLAALPANSDE